MTKAPTPPTAPPDRPSQPASARPGLWSALRRGPLLAWCFLVGGAVSALFVAWATPPFMGPDELAHAYKANLITWGRVLPEPVGPGRYAGGPTDPVLSTAFDALGDLRFHPERKVDKHVLRRIKRLRWGEGVVLGFPNTAIYAPLLYLPQSEAFAAGKVARLSVLSTLTLARTVNALTCVGLGALALAIAARRTRRPMAAVLSLPMSTFLFGTITQDGMIVAVTALGAAIVSRPMEADRPATTVELWGAAACFAIVGLAKFPYAAFGLCLALAPATKRGQRLGAALLAPALAVGWELLMHATAGTPAQPDYPSDAAAQLTFLAHRPLAGLHVAVNTLSDYGLLYLRETVGVLGWLDTELPMVFYVFASCVVAVVFALSVGGGRTADWRRMRAAAVVLPVAAVAMVFGVFYLMWSPIRGAHVEGVQGRYMLAPLVFASLAVAGPAPPDGVVRRWSGRVCTGACLSLLVVGLWVTVRAIRQRYYGL